MSSHFKTAAEWIDHCAQVWPDRPTPDFTPTVERELADLAARVQTAPKGAGPILHSGPIRIRRTP